jgi:hypothetical protein
LRGNQTTRSVPKFQILNIFIILNTDVQSLRADKVSMAIHKNIKSLNYVYNRKFTFYVIASKRSLRGNQTTRSVSFQNFELQIVNFLVIKN